MVIETTFAVGRRTVRLVQEAWPWMHGVGRLNAQWEPDLPRKLTKREWRAYRAGRDMHLAKVAQRPSAAACWSSSEAR